ncbi:MAG: tetratricopeptide repeat protein [Phycisphaerae bacterium]|nr:tetratricopeptide repeat protein [Phycisphaerae bacterium]MCZ2401155.1 tetratricopeptide repeat protein [Phycisphaerae bacterium]NUQ49292.1 tetratricopeptide repeat protein [Phycisphaerae bacterium]
MARRTPITLRTLLVAALAAGSPALGQTTQPTDLPPLPVPTAPPSGLESPGEAGRERGSEASGPGVTRIDPATMSLEALVDTARQLLETRTDENFKRAQQLAGIALQRDPRHLEALELMAEIQDMAGDVHAARQYYLKVLGENRADFRANLGMGRTHVRSRLWRQAVPYLEQALLAAPPDRRLDVLTLLAKAYQGRGDRTRAVETAQQAVALEGKTYAAWEIMVEALLELNEFDKAVRESQRLEQFAAQRLKDDPLSLENLQYLDRAFDLRISTLRIMHRSLLRVNSAGVPIAEVRPGREAEAAATLAEIVDISLRRSELQGLIARHQLLAFAIRAIEIEGGNPANHVRLGKLRFEIGDRQQAAESFRRALELDPGNAEAQEYLAALQPAASAR